jgi:hypothetical protein
MSLYYAQEKAYEALRSLGSGEGSLAERLGSAIVPSYRDLAAEAGAGHSGLHAGLVGDLLALFEEIQGIEPPDEPVGDAMLATLKTLEDTELSALAGRLLLLCVEALQTRGPDAWLLEAART